jgi:maltooligosyltrehalose trehalohydrolase
MADGQQRRFAVGAEPSAGGTHFRVWAPKRSSVRVVSREDDREHALTAEGNGYFSGFVVGLYAGACYQLKVDEDARLYPDPATRFQPDGPHGTSQIVSADHFEWRDADFREATDARVIYELHVGTFTPEGTFRAAAAQCAELAALGVTTLELMPVNGFPGRFGWGYDGVNLWAPTQLYGSPDDLRFLVATAHAHGLGVILDVVYNHFGPDGNYLRAFSDDYFTDAHACDWGEAIYFDGPESAPVREFFCENARYWIEEFHFDGLRLDATQAIFDDSAPHVIADIVRAARRGGEHLGKPVWLVAENEPQDTRLARSPEAGGYGLNALWNDDFHHSARVALTGRHEYYYRDYRGTAQELLSALKWGYLFQGQHSDAQRKRRGTSALDLDGAHFVTYLQNHDQVANSSTGARIDRLTSPGELRALTALFLLSPPTPMLFQGQEFASSAPFSFFIDHHDELSQIIHRERHKFLAQFPAAASAEVQAHLAQATSQATFERCKLDFSEREQHAHVYRLHRDLLQLRRTNPAIQQRRTDRMHGSVLAERALALRIFCDRGDRLILTNLGADLELMSPAEPLLAPEDGSSWEVEWASEALRYGGQGYGPIYREGKFSVPARSSVLLGPAR